ncbi:MAG TPA: DUF6515 family protein [Puia sp.]|nr:DUF6515 family protein [Puia sp.]
MQTALTYNSILAVLIAALAIAGCPKAGMAQRFNHGGFSRPAAPAAPARQEARPAAPPMRQEARPVAPPIRQEPRQAAPVIRPDERPTINGGGRNIGNHDFNRPAVVQETVNVNRTVNVHDHVNVYHTGGYRGIHPYYYHPYRPYYWGPHWHPLGFFLTALAADAVFLNFNNQRYYYDDGVYYQPANGGYSVVPAPVGAIVADLPPGYETTMVGNDTYFYFGGAFYVNTGQGYQVVVAPAGAVITQLPVGAVEQQVNGETLLVYNNTYYAPISQDGQDAYEVVNP